MVTVCRSLALQHQPLSCHFFVKITIIFMTTTNKWINYFLQTGNSQLHTYCPDFHHSMTVVPVNTEELARQAKVDSISAWRSPSGWHYPGKKTMIDSNVHPLKLHPARVDQLQEVFFFLYFWLMVAEYSYLVLLKLKNTKVLVSLIIQIYFES